MIMMTLCIAVFHPQRDYLVNHAFKWHPAMVKYIKGKYSTILTGGLETVSIHFRLGGVEEPSQVDFEAGSSFKFPGVNWYKDIMTKQFDPAKHIFVIFADNVPKMEREYLMPVREVIGSGSLHYHIVEEDFANSMLLMSLCKHHVGTSSTYSFWGIYLDVNQPHGGRTIFPANWKEREYGMDLPYAEWELKPLS